MGIGNYYIELWIKINKLIEKNTMYDIMSM